jgi:hypothetical protein
MNGLEYFMSLSLGWMLGTFFMALICLLSIAINLQAYTMGVFSLITAGLTGNPFDLNINKIGKLTFNKGKYLGDFIITKSGPKRIRKYSRVMFGKAIGVLSYGDMASTINPEALAAVNSLPTDSQLTIWNEFYAIQELEKQLATLTPEENQMVEIPGETMTDFIDFQEEDGSISKKEVEVPLTVTTEVYLKQLIESRKDALKKVSEIEVPINYGDTLRIGDIENMVNDDVAQAGVVNYGEDQVKESKVNSIGGISEDTVKFIIIIAFLLIMAYMVVTNNAGSETTYIVDSLPASYNNSVDLGG